MAIKFQYNKTSLGDLGKQLKSREKALPTIKSKESALRLEVKKAKEESEAYLVELTSLVERHKYMSMLWCEFDDNLISVTDIELGHSKIAGVNLPYIKNIVFSEKSYNLFSAPIWIGEGVELLKKLAEIGLNSALSTEKAAILEYARKKTTQKVNLYEKVQIPGYKEAMLKIKRFLEDEENLSKSSQKIVKSRHEAAVRREQAS